MSDQLLSYYERELAYVRRALEGFGSQFPDHAASMRLNQSGQEDPNISRLIDAVALLTAKTEKRMDEQFPEVLQDLFNVLYPGYLQIIPSYAPFCLSLEGDAGSEPVTLPKGAEMTAMANQTECIFTSVDDLQIMPFAIEDITATSAPFNFPTPVSLRRADTVIQVTLACDDPAILFSQLTLHHFDFYVRGFENSSKGLIDLLLLNTEALSLTDDSGHQVSVDVKRFRSRIAEPGFNWLPQYGNHLSGFDQLRDYFAFPDKAAYLRIEDLGKELMRFSTNKVTLNFFVQQLPTEYLRLFTKQVFALNTVPAINLYQQHGEPIRYGFTKLSMPVIADVQMDSELAVVSVDAVSEVLPTGDKPLMPIYEGGYWLDEQSPKWQVRQHWDEKGRRLMDIAISDDQLNADKGDVVLSLLLSVCNGRLPCLIPSHSEAELLAAIDLPGTLRVLKTPTAPQYPALENNLSWRFIALINANFSGLIQTEDPTRALQDAIRLCSHSIHCNVADSIKKVSYNHLVAPVTIGRQSIFSSGTEVTLLLDNELLDSEFAVVSEVLNVYFQQFCSFDRFIQVSVERFGSDEPGIQFDKCHGSQICL
ncbi:type VI secretion system baseplate subunit TssF [Photobacterium sanctipauli]|uniref:Type VI secretion system baseplate subunit TssF n=1 Tax=Photobacterium sanctipauli TaxID=1342794 RepID=A0A2T3NYQ7_9GAMM|nr:type VI secretion system baseplate subunit TssF [Photobacterium sanctipauli]PSW21401.1 type VI secretion system baseplate subunit TssF [Photobacterium sanctipauli]